MVADLAVEQDGADPRLDYSKPPTGYVVMATRRRQLGQSEHEITAAAWALYKASNDPPGCSELFNCAGLDAEGEQVRGWKFRFGITSDEVLYATVQLARAAAWAWYDRRLALAGRVVWEHCGSTHCAQTVTANGPGLSHRKWCECTCDGCTGAYTIGTPWPRCLTWSDEQVAAIERWLVDSTVEMPEVLRG